MNQVLFSPKISLGRLDRRVAQQQLDLLKLAAGGPTQLRAGPSKVCLTKPVDKEDAPASSRTLLTPAGSYNFKVPLVNGTTT